ncbi:MAG: hypothetical protein QW491_14890 [Thermoproteota archaeon]
MLLDLMFWQLTLDGRRHLFGGRMCSSQGGSGFSRRVDLALQLDRVSSNFLVELSPEEALAFVERAGCYNGFTVEGLTELVSEVNRAVQRMGGGCRLHKFVVGNEGSRVIYVVVPKFGSGERIDFLVLAELFDGLALKASADEFGVFEDSGMYFVYRFWWD